MFPSLCTAAQLLPLTSSPTAATASQNCRAGNAQHKGLCSPAGRALPGTWHRARAPQTTPSFSFSISLQSAASPPGKGGAAGGTNVHMKIAPSCRKQEAHAINIPPYSPQLSCPAGAGLSRQRAEMWSTAGAPGEPHIVPGMHLGRRGDKEYNSCSTKHVSCLQGERLIASLTLIQCCKNVFKSGKTLSNAHDFHSYMFSPLEKGMYPLYFATFSFPKHCSFCQKGYLGCCDQTYFS